MLVHLDDALDAVLPEDQLAELTRRDAAVAATTDAVDFQRCLHCARWAVELAGANEDGPVGRATARLRAVVHELHDVLQGARLGAELTDVRAATEVELRWVDDAVAAAVAAAEVVGWEQVPWPQLIDELVGMEPVDTGRPATPTSTPTGR
jgi:hypothetical protein